MIHIAIAVLAILAQDSPKSTAEVQERIETTKKTLNEAESRYVRQQVENLTNDDAGLWKMTLIYRNPNAKSVVVGTTGGNGIVASTGGSDIVKDTGTVFVFRVVDETTALIGLGPANGVPEYLLKGFPTKDFKEGKWCKCAPGPVATISTTSYKPLAGAYRDVPEVHVAKTATSEGVVRDIEFVRKAKHFESVGDACYLKLSGPNAQFELPDGSKKEVPMAKLSAGDRSAIAKFTDDERKRSRAMKSPKSR